VATLAAACGLSRSHFAHAFRATTGVPPHKWLLLHRVRHACEMMERTDTCLAEIAHSCGFADQSHFSRTFRSVMGNSPAVWRRERRSGVTAIELGF
jgi:AraC-like DNA-binding protein